jgi:transposase
MRYHVLALQKEIRVDFEPITEHFQMSGSEGTLPLQQCRSPTAMHSKKAGSGHRTHATLIKQRLQCYNVHRVFHRDRLHGVWYIHPTPGPSIGGKGSHGPSDGVCPTPVGPRGSNPRRYEVIRLLTLLADGTATQRAQDTHTHPDTVRRWLREFRQQGMLGLMPCTVTLGKRRRGPGVCEAVRQEIDHLKALYAGFHARELVRIIFLKRGERIDHKTAQKLGRQSPVVSQATLPLRALAPSVDRYETRIEVIKLYYQGWDKVSISRLLPLSWSTIDRWITRFEAAHLAGLIDKKHGPKTPPRKGLPHTRILLWVYGKQLRAMREDVVLAEYHCRYAWQDWKVTALSEGIFYPTRFVSPQGSLLPLTPQTSLVLYRPRSQRGRQALPAPAR